jgi:hydroxyethylthiazole kinase-like uncharacterized protein yjeF
MTPLYLTAQIRTIEQQHKSSGLMEQAGLAAAELACALLADSRYSILVLAGPGNNGGDAFVAARYLHQWWHHVTLVFTGNADMLSPEARAAYDTWLASGGKVSGDIPADKTYDLVIDGLFGIGLTRDVDARHAVLITAVNSMAATRLALDMPSGLCADTGRVLGSSFQADHTITFIALKPGLFTLHGPDIAGQVHLAELGIDTKTTLAPQGWLLNRPPALPAPRLRNSHKGSYGSVGIIGGNTSMVGAALLTARAALLTGAGRVYAGLLTDDAPGVDMAQPELMLRSVDSLYKLEHLSALAVGPGMGLNSTAETALNQAINHAASLILDADALNLLASRPSLRKTLIKRATNNTVLTPHPGEAATLLACSNAEIQADRIAAARKIAQEFNAITVLKGCGSVIAIPDGRWFINASGNPGLSSAGMGDVLAGIIASLAAQGMALEPATLLGVHLHGAAADALVADGIGPIGLTAGEVTLEARNLLNSWIMED